MEIRYNCIWIAGTRYDHEELQKIPNKFLPEEQRTRIQPSTPGHEDEQGAAAAEPKKDVQAPPNETSPEFNIPQNIGELIRPGEKMRITKYGLLFSGDTAYPSNMYPAPVKFNQKDYSSNEQAFQCTKASRHECEDLAEMLKSMTRALEIKIEAADIVTTEEWNQQAPGLLWNLFDQKMKDNPDLLERLILTAPLPLIEASTSFRWGGGVCPVQLQAVRHWRI